MAKKISELTTYDGTPTTSSADVIPVVQNGTTKKISLGSILTAASSGGGGGGSGKEPGTISVYYTNKTVKGVSNATELPETVYDGCIVHVLRPMGPDSEGYTTCTNLILPRQGCLKDNQTFILRLENSNPNDSDAATINVYTPDLSDKLCTKLCTVNFDDNQQHVILVSKRSAYQAASTKYDFTYLGPYNNMAYICKFNNNTYDYKNGFYLSITELEQNNITLDVLADVVKGYRNTSFKVTTPRNPGAYYTIGLMCRDVRRGVQGSSYDNVNILVLDSDGTWKNISTM